MVLECQEIERLDGTRVGLKQKLDCKNHGAAKCRMCNRFYVGQTINKFSERWNDHRSKWKGMVEKGEESVMAELEDGERGDSCALFMHYLNKHKDVIWKNGAGIKISEAFQVIFV